MYKVFIPGVGIKEVKEEFLRGMPEAIKWSLIITEESQSTEEDFGKVLEKIKLGNFLRVVCYDENGKVLLEFWTKD
jgi:hypothetical protein